MKKSVVEKYLANYSESEVVNLESLVIGKLAPLSKLPVLVPAQFTYSLVIPAYQESVSFIENFTASALAQQKVLLIVVVNQPDNDLDITPQQLLYQQACKSSQLYNAQVIKLDPQFTLLALTEHASLLLVNRFEQAIPAKQGVGLARKIGCDIALWCITKGFVTSPFISSSDADASLPNDYFQQQAQLTMNDSGAYYNFHHHSEHQQIAQANQQYEHALRYYVAGLRDAKSPYDFYTIGSILVINSQAYAMARGFPKRSAGEDFYLLNKIAKLGNIVFFEPCTVLLQARVSTRVPFGTGPAIKSILELEQQNKPYCYYHPFVFSALKLVLEQESNIFLNRFNIQTWLAQTPQVIADGLINIGFIDFIQQHQKDSEQQFKKQFPVWFDAFKTLKFIHAIRELGYPDVPLTEAIASVDFYSVK